MRSAQATTSPSGVAGAGRDHEWLRMPSSVSAHRLSGRQRPRRRPTRRGRSRRRGRAPSASSLAWPPGPCPQSWPRAMASVSATLSRSARAMRRGHLGHLEGVGQPGALVVVGEDEDLGLAGQAPEGGGVQDAVAVALEAGAPGVGRLGRRPGGRRRSAAVAPPASQARLGRLPLDRGPGPPRSRPGPARRGRWRGRRGGDGRPWCGPRRRAVSSPGGGVGRRSRGERIGTPCMLRRGCDSAAGRRFRRISRSRYPNDHGTWLNDGLRRHTRLGRSAHFRSAGW